MRWIWEVLEPRRVSQRISGVELNSFRKAQAMENYINTRDFELDSFKK